jgi:putative transposase
MPRSSQYLLEGYTYHLTHRCHGRQFFLRSRDDRKLYREWLREGVSRFEVSLYAYCVTRNHVHVVAHAHSRESISRLMHLAARSVAKYYNPRTGRINSMWEHPYHCTVIEDGKHLLNCLRYVDLNMVRAAEVAHASEWPQCGYDELIGKRKRYPLLDLTGMAERVGDRSAKELQEWHAHSFEKSVAVE